MMNQVGGNSELVRYKAFKWVWRCPTPALSSWFLGRNILEMTDWIYRCIHTVGHCLALRKNELLMEVLMGKAALWVNWTQY